MTDVSELVTEVRMNRKQMLDLMGRTVVVTAVLYPTYETVAVAGHGFAKLRQLAIKPLEEPRVGWVVGIRWLQEGFLNEAFADDEGDYQRAWLGINRTVPCLQVSFWPTRRPVHVPLDGYRIATADERPTYLHGRRDDEYRQLVSEMMREDVKQLRRDASGRFLPAGRTTA